MVIVIVWFNLIKKAVKLTFYEKKTGKSHSLFFPQSFLCVTPICQNNTMKAAQGRI
jgi:hypothetical protein